MRIFTTTKTRCGLSNSFSDKGFTVVELMLVVLIIALLAGTSLKYGYRTYKRMLIEKAATQIYLAAKYARLSAIESQTNCRLMIDGETNSFCLVTGDVDEQTGQGGTVISNPYARKTQFPDEVEFKQIEINTPLGSEKIESYENTEIVFRSNGTADTAVLKIGNDETQYTVYILAATARAKILPPGTEQMPIEIVDLDVYQ